MCIICDYCDILDDVLVVHKDILVELDKKGENITCHQAQKVFHKFGDADRKLIAFIQTNLEEFERLLKYDESLIEFINEAGFLYPLTASNLEEIEEALENPTEEVPAYIFKDMIRNFDNKIKSLLPGLRASLRDTEGIPILEKEN